MAFVRWRGNSAALLTTIYEQGRSRQVQLCNLGSGYTVPSQNRDDVAERFPGIRVDWDAVERELAEGPPAERAARAAAAEPSERVEWLELERRLRYWAGRAEPRFADQAERLQRAADVLGRWRRGKPAFPVAQPLPGWDDALHGDGGDI